MNSEKKLIEPTILVVGASMGGTEAFTFLKSVFKVEDCPNFIVLEKCNVFYFHDASPRSLLNPDFSLKSLWGYENYLDNSFLQGYKNHKCSFIKGELKTLTKCKAILSTNEEISFDYCVLVTGCTLKSIFKPIATTYEEYIDLLKSYQGMIQEAKNINIIGGGPSACELAAEIKTRYPFKSVTIIHSQPNLLAKESYSIHTKRRLEKWLKGLGVVLILENRVNLGSDMYIHGRHSLQTSSGLIIESDLTIKAISTPIPNSSFLPQSCLDSHGFIKVDEYLRTEYSNVFAMGDVACTNAPKMTRCLRGQAKSVAHNIYALYNSKPLKVYYPPKDDLIVVTLGRFSAVGQIPLPWDWVQFLFGWIVDIASGLVKGPNMFGFIQKRKFGLAW